MKNAVQALFKARKVIRTYPEGNPTYLKAVDTVFGKFAHAFQFAEELPLQIRQHEVLFRDEQMDYNPERHDNPALLLYKDGIRELAFKNTLTQKELEAFLRTIARDEGQLLDIDMVTLLWENDFRHISYVVDESVLTEDAEQDPAVTKREMEEPTAEDELIGAYRDALSAEGGERAAIVPLSDADLHELAAEFEKSAAFKRHRFITVVFELLYLMEDGEHDEAVAIMTSIIDFLVRDEDVENIVNTLEKIAIALEDPAASPEMRSVLAKARAYMGAPSVIERIGMLLDGEVDFDDDALRIFLAHLDGRAIPPFITVLGKLETISARKRVIDILSVLGRRDLDALLKGLHDERWYVVRNVVCALRDIGDRAAVPRLLEVVDYPEARVRRECVRTLGDLKTAEALPALHRSLGDNDLRVRLAALRALKQIGTDEAKQLLLQQMKAGEFIDKDYEEKRPFFECLASWKDREVAEFLGEALKKQTLMKREKNNENRACAAYALGLIGDEHAVALLKQYESTGSALFKEHVQQALRKLGGSDG